MYCIGLRVRCQLQDSKIWYFNCMQFHGLFYLLTKVFHHKACHRRTWPRYLIKLNAWGLVYSFISSVDNIFCSFYWFSIRFSIRWINIEIFLKTPSSFPFSDGRFRYQSAPEDERLLCFQNQSSRAVVKPQSTAHTESRRSGRRPCCRPPKTNIVMQRSKY